MAERPRDDQSAEINALRDDARLVLRALDHEVGRLVGVIERFERALRAEPPTNVRAPASKPTTLADLRE